MAISPPYVRSVESGILAIVQQKGTFINLENIGRFHPEEKTLEYRAVAQLPSGKKVSAIGNTPTRVMFELVKEFYLNLSPIEDAE